MEFVKNCLTEMFPNKSHAAVDEVLRVVESQIPHDEDESKLEAAIDLLIEMEDDADTPLLDGNDDDLNRLNEARGVTTTPTDEHLSQYFNQLMIVFPDACPTYVRNLCFRNVTKWCNLDQLIDEMTSNDYPKKQTHPREIFDQLREMLPNADPSYLQEQADNLSAQSEDDLKNFIDVALEKGEYPTMETYLKNQKENDIIAKYTDKFDLEAFLKEFPNPELYFSDPAHIQTLNDEIDELYVKTFLYNHYIYLRKKDIDRVLKMYSMNILKTCVKLDTIRKALSVPRKTTDITTMTKNIELLKFIAYLKHRTAIKRHIKQYDLKYQLLKEEAINNGLLQTCACCFDEELIPEECYFCKNGCIFCKDCIKKGAETIIGDGKLEFPCLADCGAEYSIPTLQMVLDSVVFSRMAQRKQMEEIKRANIDGLETCPFCDFATIPPPDSKIFTCLNEECKKESCRECRHVSHIPLRCNEIEYDEDVKMRTYIENKMTEALLRTCWKCNKMFIKESGCNKMTCNCGAIMCYVCGQSITNYSHFGDDGIRCPLYTQDLNKFHTTAVLEGAKKAKVELGVDKNPSKLKNDPTKGLV